MKTLVIGYGNVLRGDDGVGLEVARLLEARHLEEVEVRAVGQLQIEWAAEWVKYDRVIMIDAALAGPPVTLRRLPRAESGSGAATKQNERESARDPISLNWSPAAVGTLPHEMAPETLLQLASALYGNAPEVYICEIRGESFEFGYRLTPSVREAAKEAVEQILRLMEWVPGARVEGTDPPDQRARQPAGTAGTTSI